MRAETEKGDNNLRKAHLWLYPTKLQLSLVWRKQVSGQKACTNTHEGTYTTNTNTNKTEQ